MRTPNFEIMDQPIGGYWGFQHLDFNFINWHFYLVRYCISIFQKYYFSETTVPKSLKLPRAPEVIVCRREAAAPITFWLGCDVTCFRKLIHTLYRPEWGVRGAIQVSETRECLFRATVESGRGCLLVNFLHWSADPTIALGRYMKACRASDTGHKATEEDLSNRDTLVWSYPKVRTAGQSWRIRSSTSSTLNWEGCQLSKMAGSWGPWWRGADICLEIAASSLHLF